VNPARSTGPAVIVGGWALSQLWMFWVAPIAGATVGALVYSWMARPQIAEQVGVGQFEKLDEGGAFEFANPAALVGPGAVISAPDAAIELDAGLAGLVGLDAVVAVSPVARLRAPALAPPKDRDFGIVLGPWFTTLDEAPRTTSVQVTAGGATTKATANEVDWEGARLFAEANTRLRVGDLLLAPATVTADVPPGEAVVDVAGLGRLELAAEAA